MDYSSKAYDKAKWHYDSISQEELDPIQAYVHTAFYWRWLLENKLVSEEFLADFNEECDAYYRGDISALRLYEIADGCLIGDMITEEGNMFSSHYFEFETGNYLKDYMKYLAGNFKTEFHVTFSDENYAKIKPAIDAAYEKWKKPWWKVW